MTCPDSTEDRRLSIVTTATETSSEVDQDELVGTIRIENRFLREHVRALNRDPKDAEKEDSEAVDPMAPPRWADETFGSRKEK